MTSSFFRSTAWTALPFLGMSLAVIVALGAAAQGEETQAAAEAQVAVDFARDVAPILERRCMSCHDASSKKGSLNLSTHAGLLAGGDSGEVIAAGKPDESYLIDSITPTTDGKSEMPKSGPPLTAKEIETLRSWIAAGAKWPEGKTLVDKSLADLAWWSLAALKRPAVPAIDASRQSLVRNPIDAFLLKKLEENSLTYSAEADRRTLIRRLYYDLIGLPPAPEEVAAFVASDDPQAYEKLVDDLLSRPGYGERWARHWIDVVHYADTHGYDKDKLRPNAWPYRDYVIRSLNTDKPYRQFMEEQLAGDVLYPGTSDGIVALGFISAGPWDYVGHAEVPESKVDGMMARNLDRDDMVSTTMNVFCSITTQCARCHNHKFDPVTMDDYYSLQAVFAALDRADRTYDADPSVAAKRVELIAASKELDRQQQAHMAQLSTSAGTELAKIDARSKELTAMLATQQQRPEFGYHSGLTTNQSEAKWVQIDLGKSETIAKLVIVGCFDDFNSIGAGFGFPLRYKVETCDDEKFAANVTLLVDQTQVDVRNPGITPQVFEIAGKTGRFVRITATKLAPRQNDFNFALSEVQVFDPTGMNLATGKSVAGLDSIEAPPRWRASNLVDGIYYGEGANASVELKELAGARAKLIEAATTPIWRAELERLKNELSKVQTEIQSLPPQQQVYSGTIHHGGGTFTGTGATGGKPRAIFVLDRGEVTKPLRPVGPGTVPIIPGRAARFELPEDAPESARRVELAKWIVSDENPLTWRSIVNRVWQYHFGRGIVDSPNDFGRMGQLPTHPQLLDWMAAEFRDNGGKFKALHKLICTSTAYRQASTMNEAAAEKDAENTLLWRMNRRRVDAECVRDATLVLAGKMRSEMGGPGYRDFVLEKPENSPHFEYQKQDPDDPATHRRSIYRFIVRSAPDPFMETLDCADPSQLVDKRNETITALSALAMLNNKFMVRMSEHIAERLAKESDAPETQVKQLFQLALSRDPSDAELAAVVAHAREHGMASCCRMMLNMNEFVFVD